MMEALFIPAKPGDLFAVYFAPDNGSINRAIIHVPAFAEEMNKSRRLVCQQARSLAKRGYAVLIPDLFGTGDSAGDFSDAGWDIWLKNIADAISWLQRQGARHVDLWGLRTGCLLAMDYASRHPQQIEHLLCWQPVVNGDAFLNQFLRLRIVAAVMDNKAPREKTLELKLRLLNGESIEVAGYTLSSAVARSLQVLHAEQLDCNGLQEIAVVEIAPLEQTQNSAAMDSLCAALRNQGVNTALIKVTGDPFWLGQESRMNADLLRLSDEKAEQWL